MERGNGSTLDPSVERIIEEIGRWAAGYSTGLKWNEVAKLKADMRFSSLISGCACFRNRYWQVRQAMEPGLLVNCAQDQST